MQDVLDPATEDAMATWGAQVAQQADAELELIAWSGACQSPFSTGQLQQGANPPTAPQLFRQKIAGSFIPGNFDSSNGLRTWFPQVR